MSVKPIQTVEPGEEKEKRRKKKEKPKPKNWLHGIWLNWIKPIGLAILVVFAIRWTLIDWNDVPSASMEPTILVGDRIFVNKLAYHLKFPFTHWKIATWDEPERGEIVVFFGQQGLDGAMPFPIVEVDKERNAFVVEGDFNAPELIGESSEFLIEAGDLVRVFALDCTGDAYKVSAIEKEGDRTRITVRGDVQDFGDSWLIKAESKRMIKRVVGVPGDVILVQNNVMTINGGAHDWMPVNEGKYSRLDLDPPRNREGPLAPEFVQGSATFHREQMGEVVHPIMRMLRQSDYADFGPVTVPEGHFFVMGDNRNNSRDARDPRLGFISTDELVGRSFGVAFSIDKIPAFRFRFERFIRGFDQDDAE